MPGLGAISPRWTRLRYYMSVYRYANHCHVVYAMELWDGEPPTRTASSMSPGLGHWNLRQLPTTHREPHQPDLQHGGPKHNLRYPATPAHTNLQQPNVTRQPYKREDWVRNRPNDDGLHNDAGDARTTGKAPLSTFDARIGECRPSAPMPTPL
ncbi:hypothetical protein DFP72DRAFT_897243 [Ephemerocybe angulata]|uniref:Uncharacterized protein n=1 Tax=Ephemerocybe angulata TaxID=980116 RepID=A0A8H6M7M1_9AGAR|nr:hypothetical protein DFP72DRAFT_897243 [Tulosesus angulatus]